MEAEQLIIPFYKTLEKSGSSFYLDTHYNGLDTTLVTYEILAKTIETALEKAKDGNTPFNPVYWMRERLTEAMCAVTDLAITERTAPFPFEEMANTFTLIIDAYDFLAYESYDPERQKRIKEMWRNEAILLEAIERDPEGERFDFGEGFYLDRIELPDAAALLLKLVSNMVGLSYDGKQVVFYYSTILDQPPPVEESQAYHRRIQEK